MLWVISRDVEPRHDLGVDVELFIDVIVQTRKNGTG
jgi:hypothetical protein